MRTAGDLVKHIKYNEVKKNGDSFTQGEKLRPGILVLINEVDWEIENTVDYVVQDGDEFVFISTLHGG